MANFNSILEHIDPQDLIKEIEFNGEKIKVKQYLPANQKLSLIGTIVELAHEEDFQFANPVKVNFFTCLEIVYAYTDLEFDPTEQEENPGDIYDRLHNSGLLDDIMAAIPQTECQEIVMGVDDTINAYYSYQNSVMGILDTVKQDYSNLDLDLKNINEEMANPNTLGTIKEILTKIG